MLLISHTQSEHKRTQCWLSSSSMSSMTQVPLTLPLGHAQDVSHSFLIHPKGCHNSMHYVPTQKCPPEQRKEYLPLSERKVFPRSPAQTSPRVPLSRTGSQAHSLATKEPAKAAAGIFSFYTERWPLPERRVRVGNGCWIGDPHVPQTLGKWHPTPVLSPGKIPWMEEPGRLQPMGS